ncbi:MAG: hypothetical protein KR126chlam5_01295 [Candidatus Anoxychlamydiales bacterium]|nr:hypothetical protein [Candidatus Anoxychlamydiales bacterium]
MTTLTLKAKALSSADIAEHRPKQSSEESLQSEMERITNEVSRRTLSGAKHEMDHINPDVYLDPVFFISDKDHFSKEIRISEIEGSLVVLEEKEKGTYIISDVPIETALLRMSQVGMDITDKISHEKSIAKVLFHKDFEAKIEKFVERTLELDEEGIPELFKFSKETLLEMLDLGVKFEKFNPLQNVDSSGCNLFIYAIKWLSKDLLLKLSTSYSQEFKMIAQNIVQALLENPSSCINIIADRFKCLGVELDDYHQVILEVLRKIEPDRSFRDKFSLLSMEQQRELYDFAYIENNPFIYEPADVPVRGDQYSVNLMWINEKKISPDQKFLFGDGDTPEECKSDFISKFVIPVSEWAKANLGSTVNIWYDSEMATPEAITGSQEALEINLEGVAHGEIIFKDVREIDLVRSNSQIFKEEFSVYFRADLLRVIIGDHLLRNKKVEYFIYADIDMKPISSAECFDKRTVGFLDKYGFVMAQGNGYGPSFENGFFILTGKTPFLEVQRKILIDNNIKRAMKYSDQPKLIDSEKVFKCYKGMLMEFFKEIESQEKNYRKICKIMPKKPVSLPHSQFSAF